MNPYYQVRQQQADKIMYPEIDDDAKFQQYKHRNRLTIIGEPQFLGEDNYFTHQLIPKHQTKQGQDKGTMQGKPQKQEPKKQVIHKIQEDDTLQGLSLIYDVSITKIKQRNGLESNEIYYLKTIIIPDPKFIPTFSEVNVEEVKIRDFMGYLERDDRSPKTARYYLSENDWDVQKAIKEYQQDLQWEKNDKKTKFAAYLQNQQQQHLKHHAGKVPRNLVQYRNIEMIQMQRGNL